jgi:hypothetical protein
MNCQEIARALSKQSPLPALAQEHVKNCRRCQEFVNALNPPEPEDRPSPETLRQIAGSISANLRPVRPIAPVAHFIGSFLGIFALIAAAIGYGMGAFAIGVMTRLQISTIFIALAVSSAVLAYSLAHQMVPGSYHRFPPRLLPFGITIGLSITTAIVFHFQQEPLFWAGSWPCIRAGIPIAMLASVPFFLIMRRGVVLAPRMTGAATGLLAGLVGTTVLEIHCQNLDAWHILASHIGVAILCALAGLAIGWAVEVRATVSST